MTKKEVVANEVVAETKADAVVSQQANTLLPKTAAASEYVVQLLKKAHDQFLAANEGFDLDYVYTGTWLMVNSKGQFYDKDNETKNFGDKIQCVLGSAEQRFMLWGKDDSDEDGNLLIAEHKREDAEEKLAALKELNPGFNYDVKDIQSRQLLYLVMMSDVSNEFPTIYMLSLPLTGKLAFGKWALNVYKGASAANGVKAGTPLSAIITQITTIEMKNQAKQNYIGYQFEAISMFDISKI